VCKAKKKQLTLMLALFFLLLFLGSSAQAQDGSFPPELDDMMIIGGIGVSIDLLFDDNELAREKINEALDEDGISFADIVINFTRSDQLFWLITRQAPTADEVAAILAGMTGYWDQNGNWVQWVAPEPQTGSIYGYIVMYDAADQPDASAEVLVTVEAQNGQRYTAIVETFGDDGSYEYKYLLEGLAPDKYALVARADGYVPSETHVVTVEAGEQVGEVNFKLQRAEVTSSISGEVIMLDAGGQPDTGAAVEVTINCHTGYGPGYAHVVNSKDDGQYIYPYTIEMAPGEYTVYATATGYHYSEKQVVTVNEGDEITGVNFKLQKIAVPAKEVGSIQLDGFGDELMRFVVKDTDGNMYNGTLDGAVTLRERAGHELTSSASIRAAEVVWDPNISSGGFAVVRFIDLEMDRFYPRMPIEVIIETDDGKVALCIDVTLEREIGKLFTPARIVDVKERDVIFEEDFTGLAAGAIPAEWRKWDPLGNWGAVHTKYAGGTAPEMRFYYEPFFDGVAGIISPVIDASNFSGLKLTFKHLISDYDEYYPYSLEVQVSDDGNDATYDVVRAWVDPSGNIGPETVTIDLSAYDGASTLEIAWTFTGNNDGIWAWYIDDIQLKGNL